MKKVPDSRLRKIRVWSSNGRACELFDPQESHNISLIDLASNDYLGLSQHPALIEAAQKTMLSEGVGAGASRLITGTRPIHEKLEQELSKWLGFEKVLLFPSGFQANLAAINSLANRYTPVFADRLIHHSLLVGVKISGAKIKRFAHNDLDDLEKLLENYIKTQPNQTPLVITESLFSMEGTCPSIKKTASLCKQYGAMLFVDEAHSIGVMGEQGKGLCNKISDSITMISGTFGKAFGSGGAFLATSKDINEHIIQSSGAFRYTTALAPPLAAAALAALKLIQANSDWITNLQKDSIAWRTKLLKEGWDIPPGIGPIIPLILGSDEKSLEKQQQLEANGLLTIAIRPPTVPEGSSRLRIVLRNNLPKATLDNLIFNLRDKF